MAKDTYWKCIRASILSFTLAIFTIAVTPANAQSTATATMTGAVTDASGAAIPGAQIEIKNVDTGVTQNVTTDAQGRYSAASLPVGNYQVQAAIGGFQTAVHKGITLTVGANTTVDFAMQVGQEQ